MAEEVDGEIEAMKAVYGSDCSVIQELPPHIHLHIKPRTADDISQQFVEAVLAIRANTEYPMEPPIVDIVDSKGLDGNRQEELVKSVKLKAKELTSYPMLVALCEEAIEILCGMNHPDGNCPLCLDTLHRGGDESPFLPFMKLMSCFHCFHSECIIRWWKWLQHERPAAGSDDGTARLIETASRNAEEMVDQTSGSHSHLLANCPVCRKGFHAKDIEHVLDLLKPGSSELINEEADVVDNKILSSEFESLRRQKYEAVLERQRENGGLIEPKKVETLLPGMFLPQPVVPPSLAAKADVLEGQPSDNSSESVSRETASSNGSNNAGTSEHRNIGTRKKNRAYNRRKQWNSQPNGKQWIKKEKDTA